MKLVPISFRTACAFINERHRHHKRPQGHKFSLGVEVDGRLVAVACVGRPVARHTDDGETASVTRLCSDGTRNACSFLYTRCKRAAQAMGYLRIRTEILDEEPGTSLIAAGFVKVGDSKGGTWSRPSRGRVDKHPTQPKQIFEAKL